MGLCVCVSGDKAFTLNGEENKQDCAGRANEENTPEETEPERHASRAIYQVSQRRGRGYRARKRRKQRWPEG